MKHILFFFLLLPFVAFAQWPAAPNKIRLGNQTTADGLVVRTAASPSWTPTSLNNAWLAFDTVAVKLYYYDAGMWNEYTGGSVNIGNTDLTLTGNRRLNTGGYQFWIQDGTGAEVPYIFIGGDQVSFAASTTTSVYLDSSEQRAAIIAGAVIDIDADSIRIIGTQPNDNSLNRLLALDTITNRLHYVDKASIASGGTDTNFATNNLTFTGNRVHNLSTRTLTIADGGTYPTFQQSAATDGFTLASSATDLIAQTPGLLQIENSDTITITADRIRMNAADTRIQQVAKDNALNRVMMLDSLTGQVKYRDVSSIAGGGGVSDSSSIKINNVANVRAYGALGNGSDATTAFQSAIATGLAVYVPPGRYLISSALTLNEGQQIFGNGDDCIVQVAANISVLRLTRRNSISGFRIVGDLGGADTGQYGIFMDGGASYDTTHENSIKAMSFDSLGGAGIYITRTVDEYQGNLISDCIFRKNLIGVNMDTRGEYTQLSNSQFVANTTAIRVKGGNTNISDCIISSNTTGISIVSGDNGDHGQATGCTINHNSTGVSVNGTSYGFYFLNSQMWSNSTQVNFISADNVHFIGGALSGGTISATSATNCYFSNMQFDGTITKSLSSQGVYFVNNLDGTDMGKYPTSAGDYVLRFTAPNVYEYVAAGGGGGTVSGSGTTNRVAKWSASTSLSDGLLQDDGTLLSLDDASTSTAKAFKFDSWTTAARPGTPTAGMMGYNTTLGNYDFYGVSAWKNFLESGTGNGLGTATRLFYADANGRAVADDALLTRDTLAGASYLRLGKNVTFTNNTQYYTFANDSGSRTFTNSSGATRSSETGAWRVTQDYAGAHGYSNAININSVASALSSLSAISTLTAGRFNTSVASGGTSGHTINSIRAENLALTSTLNNSAIYATSSQQSTGTTTWQRALWAELRNNSTGTTTLGAIIDVELPTNSGTITDTYGVRVRDITKGTQTNTPRSFYAEDPNAINVFNGSTMLGSTSGPARTLHVTGEARITDLTTDPPTRIVGADADGDLGSITVGTGLSLSSGTLTATGTGTTNLAFSGSSSPVTLTSDTGTDVIFSAGSGIALSQSTGTMTISRTYSLIHTTITGGSTFFGTSAERPDNDTPGSATTSAVGSDFSVSGSTVDYTGGSGALIRVEGSISFSVADDGDYYLSLYKEGTEIGATSMRISCVAGNYYSVSLPATTTGGSTNDTFDLRIATVTGNSTTTMHRYGFILERIY